MTRYCERGLHLLFSDPDAAPFHRPWLFGHCINTGLLPGKDIIPFVHKFYLERIFMKSPKDDPHSTEDSDENAGKCICKMCPTFKNNKLADYAPDALYCARGKSTIPSKIRTTNCYCLGCEIFIRHGLVISHLCDKGWMRVRVFSLCSLLRVSK